MGPHRVSQERSFEVYSDDMRSACDIRSACDKINCCSIPIEGSGHQRRAPTSHPLIEKKIADALPCHGVMSKRGRPNINIIDSVDLKINKSWDQFQVGGRGLVMTERRYRADTTLRYLNSGSMKLSVRQKYPSRTDHRRFHSPIVPCSHAFFIHLMWHS